MARDSEREPNRIDIPCPVCRRRWTGHSNEPTCPDCGASFSVQIHDEFALVERDGWAVAVSRPTVEDGSPAGVASDS